MEQNKKKIFQVSLQDLPIFSTILFLGIPITIGYIITQHYSLSTYFNIGLIFSTIITASILFAEYESNNKKIDWEYVKMIPQMILIFVLMLFIWPIPLVVLSIFILIITPKLLHDEALPFIEKHINAFLRKIQT